MSARTKGIYAALASAVFLGLAPIFGKQAILLGLSPLAVVAIRTAIAAILLFAVMALFARRYLFIYPAGLLGCLLAGWINGLGSLFYYSALGRLDAGLGHLLYSLYPLFLVVWFLLDRQPPTRLTVMRLIMALPAVVLLTITGNGPIDRVGILLMLVASALYALHLPINQRVLFDMPAPTVTLYTLLAMSAVVVPTFFFSAGFSVNETATAQNLVAPSGAALRQAWMPVLALSLVTFFSRLTLFLGVKHLGGMQTALLGLGELVVSLVFAQLWLGERFSPQQWLGAALLIVSLALIAFEKTPQRRPTGGFLSWLRPPGIPGDIPWQPHD